jgi:DNA-directed RNA polymerase specialized sigma24 family protein
MAFRCSSTGKQLIHADREASADDLFEQHLPKLALFCLRFTRDKEQAAALGDRVIQQARRKIGSAPGAGNFSGWLYSILRAECVTPVGAKSAVGAAEALCMAEEVR